MTAETNLRDIFANAEKLIVAGSIREAAALIEKLSPEGLSRAHLLTLAQLQRRTGLAEQALKILSPVVRPKKVAAPANDAEKAEYAICLQRLGSTNEAARLLDSVNTDLAPEALLYRAIICFSDWNYHDGIKPLQELINKAEPNSYLVRAAELNLGAAYLMTGQYDRAATLLEDLVGSLKSRGENLLLCNALEVYSQLDILTDKLGRADEHLKAAESILTGIKTLDRLWLMKWRAIREAVDKKNTDPLNEVQAEAHRKEHWETLRDLDFHRLRIQFDQNLFFRLYFGTHSPHFRSRLHSFFPQVEIPSLVYINPNGTVDRDPSASRSILDPYALDGEMSPGSLPQALMMLLFSDWYKRFRTGHLYAILFKNEFFNPETSLNRVHQVVKRLREALHENIPSVDIDHSHAGYRFAFEKFQVTVRLEESQPDPDPDQIRIHLLESRCGESFDSSNVQDVLKLSRSAANKLIKSWRDDQLIAVQESNAKSPRYRVNKV